MPTKVSFFWSAQQGAYLGGWSENFWHPGSPVNALASAKELQLVLLPCHSNQSKLTHIRCTPIDPSIAPVLFALAPPQVGTGVGALFGLNNMVDSILMELRNRGTNEHTRMWVKGIPDEFVQNGVLVNARDIADTILALSRALSNAPWSMYKQNVSAPQKVITAINIATGTITCPAHGYAEQDQIKLLRVKNTTKVNGTWKIYGLTADTFKLMGWNPALHIGDYIPGSGVARKVVLGIVASDAARALRVSKHDVGRPFGLYRGRATVRKT